VKWGGTCLDLTQREAQDFVALRTKTICRDWGYRYIKIDGLWTGMASAIAYVNEGYKEDNFGEAKLANPDMTHVEAYRKGLQVVREAAGDDVFILGCNLAQNMRILGPSIGFVDAMRIGPDNKHEWKQMTRGPFSGSNLYFLHGRVWYNDPDPVYVRPSVPLEQAEALLSWVTISGQLHSNSFYYADLPPERFDLLKRAIPSHNLKPRPVDLFDERTPRIWLLTDDRRDTPFYLVGLFNWSDKEEAKIGATFERIGLPKADKYVTFDYWANKFGTLEGNLLEQTLKPASCQILAVRLVADHPQLISTSRHITQGVVDVIDEKWDANAKSLGGTSRVVGGDPYELRIAKPTGAELKLKNVTADTAIQIVGEEPFGWRVRIETPTNKEVRWTAQFE
jgi:Alpha galactosidase C-terminal beta sandwich domain